MASSNALGAQLPAERHWKKGNKKRKRGRRLRERGKEERGRGRGGRKKGWKVERRLDR